MTTIILNDDFVDALRKHAAEQECHTAEIFQRVCNNDQDDKIETVRKAIAMISLALRYMNCKDPEHFNAIQAQTIADFDRLAFPYDQGEAMPLRKPDLSDPSFTNFSFLYHAQMALNDSLIGAMDWEDPQRLKTREEINAVMREIYYFKADITLWVDEHQKPRDPNKPDVVFRFG